MRDDLAAREGLLRLLHRPSPRAGELVERQLARALVRRTVHVDAQPCGLPRERLSLRFQLVELEVEAVAFAELLDVLQELIAMLERGLGSEFEREVFDLIDLDVE